MDEVTTTGVLSRVEQDIVAVVCIPTFRRPDHLRATLDSLALQKTQFRYAIVVIENDGKDQAGLAASMQFLRENGLPGLCAVEPRQGNCHAINTAFETALARFPTAEYFLMIDDDEIASPRWLETMVIAAKRKNADVVGGPVVPQFAGARTDLGAHPAFCPAYDRSGPVSIIYGSGNCLITRNVLEQAPRPLFDLRFNWLGGGDTDFFCRARERQLSFYWANEATISETVPIERTKLSWLLKRGLRIGAINFLIEHKRVRGRSDWLRLVARNVIHLPLSLAKTAWLLGTGRGIASLHPATVAIGRCLVMAGIEPHQYAAKDVGSSH